MTGVEAVLETGTPEGIAVVLPALVCAKILEKHAAVVDPRSTGSHEPVGDVLYLSSPTDDKSAPAQETPEGHAVRRDETGRITHLTAINARWLLERDGELVATLRDGRRLRLRDADVAELLG